MQTFRILKTIVPCIRFHLGNKTPKQNLLSQHLIRKECQHFSKMMNYQQLLPSGFLWIEGKKGQLFVISNFYLQKSLWWHQQDWTAKSFSRLIIFPFCYCVLCISTQWCRYHPLLFFPLQSVFLFVVFHCILWYSASYGCSEMAHCERADCVRLRH